MSISGFPQSPSTPISLTRRDRSAPGIAGKPILSALTSVPSAMSACARRRRLADADPVVERDEQRAHGRGRAVRVARVDARPRRVERVPPVPPCWVPAIRSRARAAGSSTSRCAERVGDEQRRALLPVLGGGVGLHPAADRSRRCGTRCRVPPGYRVGHASRWRTETRSRETCGPRAGCGCAPAARTARSGTRRPTPAVWARTPSNTLRLLSSWLKPSRDEVAQKAPALRAAEAPARLAIAPPRRDCSFPGNPALVAQEGKQIARGGEADAEHPGMARGIVKFVERAGLGLRAGGQQPDLARADPLPARGRVSRGGRSLSRRTESRDAAGSSVAASWVSRSVVGDETAVGLRASRVPTTISSRITRTIGAPLLVAITGADRHAVAGAARRGPSRSTRWYSPRGRRARCPRPLACADRCPRPTARAAHRGTRILSVLRPRLVTS